LVRELVAEHLARGMQLPALDPRRANVHEIARELATLCTKAATLLKANRRQAGHDESLVMAARRLDADLCIARGVIRAIPPARVESGEERESNLPPDPARRTG